MEFLVIYNAKVMNIYKSLKAAVKFIERKGYKDDSFNMCWIVNQDGICYHPNGEEYKENEY